MKTLILYATNTGNTAFVADIIASALVEHEVIIQNIVSANIEEFKDYDLLIFGTPTWGNGEVHKDWKEVLQRLNRKILEGKYVALFFFGDSAMFPEQFASGIRDIYDVVVKLGAIVIGQWKNEGYNFITSRALIGNRFCGLIIDQDNESNLTVSRVIEWVKQIQSP